MLALVSIKCLWSSAHFVLIRDLSIVLGVAALFLLFDLGGALVEDASEESLDEDSEVPEDSDLGDPLAFELGATLCFSLIAGITAFRPLAPAKQNCYVPKFMMEVANSCSGSCDLLPFPTPVSLKILLWILRLANSGV